MNVSLPLAGSPGSLGEKNGVVKVKMEEEEEEAQMAAKFTGLSKEQLLQVAGTPGWVRTRWALLILFWLGWLGMLAGAIAIIVQAPRCKDLPKQGWWQKGGIYRIREVEAFQDLGSDGIGDLIGAMASALPPNFSWVVSGLLAGLAMPRLPAHYQYMHDHGIRHLVSLTERSPPYHDSCPGIQVHRLRIADFSSPSTKQIQRFLQIVEDANAKGEAVAVHCLLGFGWTGTMLACYLAKTHKITGVNAIQKIRQLRPGSIETYDQEKAVVQFYQRTKQPQERTRLAREKKKNTTIVSLSAPFWGGGKKNKQAGFRE